MRLLLFVLILLFIGCANDPCKSVVCQNGGIPTVGEFSVDCQCDCAHTCHGGENCDEKLNKFYDVNRTYTGTIDTFLGQNNIPYSIIVSSENSSSACIAVASDNFGNQFEIVFYNFYSPCPDNFSIKETDFTINNITGTIKACEKFPDKPFCTSDICIYFEFTEQPSTIVHRFVFRGNL